LHAVPLASEVVDCEVGADVVADRIEDEAANWGVAWAKPVRDSRTAEAANMDGIILTVYM
jgi:hypothetical protein